MNRLSARMAWDTRLQQRNGFYYAAAVVALLMVILASWLPQSSLPWLLPVVLFANLLTNGFYFIGGLVLLEKGEGSLEAQLVTPLRDWEYLAGKIATLCLLSLAESLAIVLIAYGPGANLLLLIVGVILCAALFCCLGFLVVIRYDAINEYLFPSFLAATFLALPLLEHFKLWSHALFWVHPLQPPMVLLRSAFTSVTVPELAFALGGSVLWTGIAGGLCLRTFRRFVAARPVARQ